MEDFIVAFAGRSVLIRYRHAAACTLLQMLFTDLRGAGSPHEAILEIEQDGEGQFLLLADGAVIYCGTLGVAFAAALFDLVIFGLLEKNGSGVALHAGALARAGRVILIPGPSGAGKSTLTAWLVAQGYAYLTDELVILAENHGRSELSAFTRPLCLKPGSAAVVKDFLPPAALAAVLEDEDGLIVPHRLVNPSFQPLGAAPSLLLFPEYRAGAPLSIAAVPRARAAALLMACDVNGRNLADHGFSQVSRLARSAVSWRLTFSSFAGLAAVMDGLMSTAG